MPDAHSSRTATGGVSVRRVGNLLVGAAWAMWGLALAWVGLHALAAALAPCEAYWYDNSANGSPAWQWFPPGYECTYKAADSDAITVITHPGGEYFAMALLLLAFPVYVIAQRLLAREGDRRFALRWPRRSDLWSR